MAPYASRRFDKVLIANRGEIALRLIRTVHDLGLQSVAVYTDADATAPHVRAATEAVPLGSDHAAYNNFEAVVAAGEKTGAGAVLPGYGFISENADAAAAFENVGITWIGPRIQEMTLFAGKTDARKLAEEAGVPVVPGSGLLADEAAATAFTESIGYPVLLKAAAGGGGMGQAVATNKTEVAAGLRAVLGQADALFGGGGVFAERLVQNARHVEVQMFGDGEGGACVLGLRDCSIQRRRQKVVEEGPPPNLDAAVSEKIAAAAAKLCAKHNYRSAGTVEFVLDSVTGDFYFLEVNTRLQVEHGVTELTTGVDIVSWMVEQALGREVPKEAPPEKGVSIQARVYAENPALDFLPSPGVLSAMEWPVAYKKGDVTVRVDSWAARGTEVTSNYDPLLGKVLVHAPTRKKAIAVLKSELGKTRVRGVVTNVEAVMQLCDNQAFADGIYDTKLLERMEVRSSLVEVVSPGLQSSLQDYPGREGYWSIGVSPSGAMDAYSMNVANALVGNPLDASALEMTVKGAVLKFHAPAVVALAGARFDGEYDDGRPVPWWTPFRVSAGTVLELGTVSGDTENLESDEDPRYMKRPGGKIAYLSVRGGFDAPKYLGSAATFPTGKFGGEHGRFLEAGDFLALKAEPEKAGVKQGWIMDKTLVEDLIPKYNEETCIVGALNGPHGSEDFFHAESLAEMWTEPFKVHHAANRLGVRLQGPTPQWTRTDGGSAGMHPSNLHDYTYAPFAVNYSGNTPIVLMLDGPSLGGFVCPFSVATAEVWKVSQATPGTTVRFRQLSYDDARSALKSMRKVWEAVRGGYIRRASSIARTWSPMWSSDATPVDESAIIASIDPAAGESAALKVCYRLFGDEHVLVEYGEIDLDLAYRMRVHTLMDALRPQSWVKELCPGVRSLLVRYDADKMHVDSLIGQLRKLEEGALGSIESLSVPSRSVHLPLAFDCQWTKDAIRRYQASVRPNAPYLPSNVEFARRMNGLKSVDDVRNIMLSAEYCVMGLGDVYLGAPCAVPIDPRHRLVTTKMAPARLFTHEGTVGIGGAYMCIYGMDSPGGYQLMGRTIPIWDSYGAVPESHRGAPTEKPWLLRFFDRVRYYLVSDDELEDLRAKYKRGELVLDIQEGEFSYANHKEFLKENESSISEFQQLQSKAFAEERKRWEEAGETAEDASAKHAAAQVVSSDVKEDKPLQLYAVRVRAGVAATVFGVLAEDGEEVEAGQPLVSMESMKVEIMVEAPVSGTVKAVSVSKGDSANADTTLCEVHSTKELAFGDMTLMHLRTMYKIGVLELESAALAMQQSAKDAKAVVETADMAEDLKNLRKLVGRKYLPLFGASFVYAAVDGESPKKVVEALKSAGAVLVGRAESFLSASQLVAGKHVCFNVGGGMIDARGGEMAASAPLSSKYCVYAQTKEDAKIVSDAVSESVSKQESSGSCGVGWQCALS